MRVARSPLVHEDQIVVGPQPFEESAVCRRRRAGRRRSGTAVQPEDGVGSRSL